MNQMEQGKLVLSLDFELLWGIFDKVNFQKKIKYFENTTDVIPRILELFFQNQIRCTWATVGMLFNDNWEEWDENKPKLQPQYRNEDLSAYRYGNKIKAKETEKFCFAPHLINLIAKTPGQEIGTHTYSHYYCLEEGQTLDAFKADIEVCVRLANKIGIELKSLVFPRNQFNSHYLEVCDQLGIKTVRSNPDSWYWSNTQKDFLMSKIFRTGDAYVGLNNKAYFLDATGNGPLPQKSSRLLRPYSTSKFLNTLKISRIKAEITSAAISGKIYHLWWHPHNFGNNSKENIKDLKDIIAHFAICRKEFGMESANMQDLINTGTKTN